MADDPDNYPSNPRSECLTTPMGRQHHEKQAGPQNGMHIRQQETLRRLSKLMRRMLIEVFNHHSKEIRQIHVVPYALSERVRVRHRGYE
jgi:hypothetical protein